MATPRRTRSTTSSAVNGRRRARHLGAAGLGAEDLLVRARAASGRARAGSGSARRNAARYSSTEPREMRRREPQPLRAGEALEQRARGRRRRASTSTPVRSSSSGAVVPSTGWRASTSQSPPGSSVEKWSARARPSGSGRRPRRGRGRRVHDDAGRPRAKMRRQVARTRVHDVGRRRRRRAAARRRGRGHALRAARGPRASGRAGREPIRRRDCSSTAVMTSTSDSTVRDRSVDRRRSSASEAGHDRRRAAAGRRCPRPGTRPGASRCACRRGRRPAPARSAARRARTADSCSSAAFDEP